MLEGLKVVEFATYIAGPGAACLMADWGADVIKIEPPKGDPIRYFFDTLAVAEASNPLFDLDNRGKRSIALDVGKPEARAVVLKLIREADVFLTNVRPAALKRAGLDYEAVKGENPRLVYAAVTGFGLDGPDADKPGFDLASFWARAGVASLSAPKGAEPFPLRTGFGDHICSLATLSAILAALHERHATGKGRLVETSLLRTGTYAMSSDYSIQMRLGRIASTRPRATAVNPIANFFQTRDGRWLVLLPRQGAPDWPNIARAAGLGALIDDPRFAKAKARRENGPDLVAAFDAAFAAMDFAEAARRLDEEDVAWSPVQTPAEVLNDPQAAAAGCFTEMPDGKGGMVATPAGPARFHGAEHGPRGPAPGIGQHTDAVLAELGFGADEIAALRAAQAIA